MSNRYKNDYEMLSAYVDGELSSDEIKIIEQKLMLSKELNARYQELLQLKKAAASSIGRLPESPYFEERILASLNTSGSGHSAKIKKYIPAFGFTVLTIAVMLLLKFNPQVFDDIYEEQKTNIAGFYKENLKPLLFASDITKEDIFNFAFYQELPLDKESGKFLSLGYEDDGDGFFEIKNASNIIDENTFTHFVSNLDLTDLQKMQMDSILESYAEPLQAQVLVNDKNTVAINQNLWNYSKAISADLLAFASTANNEQFKKVYPVTARVPNPVDAMKLVKEVRESREKEYVFLTPDTVFSHTYEFDEAAFKDEMKKMKVEFKKEWTSARNELKKLTAVKIPTNPVSAKDFKVYVDGNSFRVQLDKMEIPKVELPNFDSIAANIEEATKHFKSFTFSVPNVDVSVTAGDKDKNKKGRQPTEIRVKAPGSDIRVVIPDVDSIMKYHQLNNDSLKNIFKNFNYNSPDVNFDSLMSGFKFFLNDSLIILDSEEFKREMRNLKKELNQFRFEMREMQKDLGRDSLRVKPKKKPIEI